MGKIGIHNYEAYLLDYLEGQLPEPLREEMQSFLKAHPAIAEEAEGLDAVRLDAPNVSFPDIDTLYQAEAAIMEETQEMLFLQAADRSLSPEGQKRLAQWMNDHPEASPDYSAAILTRLSPDEGIVFPDKAVLKKSIPLYLNPVFQRLGSVAAVLLLALLSLPWLIRPVDDLQPGFGSLINIPPDKQAVSPLVPETRLQYPRETDARLAELPEFENKPERQAAPGAITRRNDAPEIVATRDTFSLSLPALAMESPTSLESLAFSKPAWIPYRSTPYNNAAAVGALIAKGPDAPEEERSINLSWLLGRRNDRPTAVQNSGRAINPVFWDIADAGISTINVLTDQRLTLERDVDDDGNTVAYALYSDGFEIARKKRFD